MVGTRRRILIVEDDIRVQEVLEMQLTGLGYEVIPATDGEAGVRFVEDQGQDLDIVILDLNLPRLHGVDVLDKITRLRPVVPVLVLTGYSNVDVAADVMRRGAFYYLTKPVNRDRLEAEVQRALATRELLLERARLRDENLSYQHGLERLVQEKSLDLEVAMQRLLEVQDQMARADKADTLEIVMSSVVHELRNPLSVIMASVEMAQTRKLEPFVEETMRSIWGAGQQIDSVLRRTRGLGPARPSLWERVDLGEVVDTAVAITRAQLLRAGVDARVLVEWAQPITADRGRLLQLLLNLLINACQAMPSGGAVHVSARRTADPDFVRLEVCDTGPGIPADLLDQVLRPFFTTRGVEGTGLGLSIAREIVEHHGGLLVLNSEPGGGTSIAACLPVGPEFGLTRPAKEPEGTPTP